ncbi:MAG: hypothetical protein JWO37_1594 [Acidimicrobiales bacterium]|jgi:hypothetical protein|nr:hypothetical protein [Acidimicrobiales bacterium]
MSDAVFEPDGDWFVPTGLARGPWDPNQMHGGGPAALLARAVERAVVIEGEDVAVVRLTVELLRPVTLGPISVTTDVLRPGKRVQLVGARIVDRDGVEAARVTGLRVRRADLDIPVAGHQGPKPPTSPGADVDLEFDASDEHFAKAWQWRAGVGGFREPGPAALWARLVAPIVAGETTSGVMRCAALADFGNGISGILPMDEYLFINPDLTVYLHREPAGGWLCLDAVTWASPDGRGYAESAIWDERGRVGRSVQGLYLDRR